MKRLKERIRYCFKSEAGDGYVYAAVLVIILMLFMLVMGEYLRLYSTAVAIRNAMDEAVRHVVTDNWTEVFPGTREGYGGSASPGRLEDKSVAAEIAGILNATQKGGLYSYETEGQTVYSVRDVELKMSNADFTEGSLSVKAVAQVELYVIIGGFRVLPIEAQVEAAVDFDEAR